MPGPCELMNAILTDSDAPRGTRRRLRRVAVEVPTLALIFVTYAGWLLITATYGRWPLWIIAPAVTLLLTLHSSLQHEIIHGHPTRWRNVNRILGMVPLSFWLPFERYRQLHRAHHIDARLTDPLDDPEWHVYYVIHNGVRYTGMPAWDKTLSETDLWKLTAFLTRIDKLPPAVQDYWKKSTGVNPPTGGPETHEDHK